MLMPMLMQVKVTDQLPPFGKKVIVRLNKDEHVIAQRTFFNKWKCESGLTLKINYLHRWDYIR